MAKTMKMTCDGCGIEATDKYIRGFKKITVGTFTKLPTVTDPHDYTSIDRSVCLCEGCFRKYEERNGIL